jgi:hypothetical protein
MEPEGSIPNSQELSTCPYPEPDHITLFHLCKIHSNIMQSPASWAFLVASFPLAFPLAKLARLNEDSPKVIVYMCLYLNTYIAAQLLNWLFRQLVGYLCNT